MTNPVTAELTRAAVGELLLSRQTPDPYGAVLVALVRVSGLVDACVHDTDRRQARRRAKQIAAANGVGRAVTCIEREVTAAIVAALSSAQAMVNGVDSAWT